jgi:hypothetical protein
MFDRFIYLTMSIAYMIKFLHKFLYCLIVTFYRTMLGARLYERPLGDQNPPSPGSQPYDGPSQHYPSPVNSSKENEK